MLAYYHAALRSDVRGKAVLLPQNHGHSWTLFTGEGEWWAAEGRTGRIDIPLGNLPATFRMALERRADDDTIAIGWALSKGRDDGLDVIWPVGLLAARWWRADEILCIAIEQPDVMVNPAWLRAQAGSLGWSQVDLADRLGGWRGEGVGPGRDLDEFAGILREAAATAVRGRLYPRSIVPALGAEDGIWGAAALILPEEDNWSRRAVRDLEKIQNWSPEQRQGTALQAVLDPVPINDSEPVGPVLEAGPLNAEQLEAVRSGLTGRLTVVTGPPGTGKSETVSALVCSTVLAGKTVLVAARNHQALDAVEERVGGTWVVRTLDPAGDRDTSFRDAAKDLVSMPDPQDPAGDLEGAIAALGLLDGRRVKAMEERLAWRQAHLELAEAIEARGPASPWWRRLLWAMLGGRSRRSLLPRSGPLKIARLQMKAQQARPAEDAASLGEMIREAVGEILEKAFRSRLSLGDQRRGWLGRRLQDLKLHGNIDLPDDVIDLVLEARPVWLTSNLGTPARIPLRAGLFDLAVIDEASQSDIASALPILARARRVVVVGDDRQLGFISRTSGAMERNLMRAAGI
ncbi:MAG: AAA family ATPase, partial [Lewinella sp.]|nr:AAA family ATPase [Lewinella sp.]